MQLELHSVTPETPKLVCMLMLAVFQSNCDVPPVEFWTLKQYVKPVGQLEGKASGVRPSVS
jgi:hypothetical protein